ncbi:Pkr1-domain-containing protein [Setomelanomma holmii]|uniref:Pkr1-domain-containing protein n=1 Tax=Setomelanomma holmii TaxID=210430 RepID=A0A9P4HEB6_9PLEO|nr:Pkr1-domain-containing protein [Setomelanomma holmii]
MASFFENLWLSIFTPGPTPTLLVATNASFAALQLLLFAMLLATYSIHFIILSFLCGGLWWAINWFAAEIRAAQAKEEEAKRIREARRGKDKGGNGDGAGDDGEAMDTGDDTEVDAEVEVQKQRPTQARGARPESQSTVFVDKPNERSRREETPQASSAMGGPAGASTTGAATKLAPLVDDALKKRKGLGESTGDLSTDTWCPNFLQATPIPRNSTDGDASSPPTQIDSSVPATRRTHPHPTTAAFCPATSVLSLTMASINAPVSIADVVAQAGNYTYNAHIPLANWLRTANTMQKEAQVYEAEGNGPQTYLLLYRHADLVLQKLQTHPDRKQPHNRKALEAATNQVYSDLRKLELIAPRIKKRHEEYQERRRKQQEALKALEGSGSKNLPQELDGLSLQDRRSQRRSYDSRPTLDAQENQSLATRLAQREHGVSEEQEQQRRTGGRWESWQEDLAHDDDRGDLSSQLQELRRLQETGHRTSQSSVPPPLPSKIPDNRPPTPSTELDDFSFKPSAYLENGDPLRPVFLPSQLRQQFLHVASSNTRLNLETCGMLCGILKSNAMFITRLVVPEQTSTSDTCETLNEEEFFDYCDKEELLVIGWIHTHPTQTCFMSSRDLHTHVGYQVMMPESIAIVCAPTKEPSWGCFRLTDPPGKQAILNCSKPGIFHPHDVDDIYTEALKPGHVVELANAPLEIVDMRPKKKF